MASRDKLEIYGVSNQGLAVAEAWGLSNVFLAYADNCAGEDINEIGFNSMSGYVYIALENGIQIASAFGQQVEYIISDIMNDEEFFFDDYETALEQLEAFDPSYDEVGDDFWDWFDDGNVEEIEPNVYATQDAQFRNRIKGMDALRKYYNKEFK
jgi:hypothetical protein